MPRLPRPTPKEELDVLQEVSLLLGSTLNLDEVLGPVLRSLHDGARMTRATLSIRDPIDDVVRIEASHGMTPSEIRRGVYELGEGITGWVAEHGEPSIVPRIADEPRFADKTGALEIGERSFVCVPIPGEDHPLGTLSGYRPVSHPTELEADVRLLTITAQLLAPAVRHRILARGLSAESEVPASDFRPPNLIGRARSMQRVFDLVGQVAGSSTTVLLRGESGTGKELVAEALHVHSPRAHHTFVKVNCAALSENLLESELFGHERGAFTGAHSRRKGRFELAHRGTIFLDEIGDLAPTTQIKLLRVLQQKTFERVGSNDIHHADVRVVAATSRDLEAMIETEDFRSDLYYRLNVFPIHLPPLRERKADVLLLADHFTETFGRSHGKTIQRIATPAIDMLMAYHWPGNVRELENCIERAVLLTRGDTIHAHHLPPTLRTADESPLSPEGNLKATLDVVERDLILDALKATRGNMRQAAHRLGISERIMGLRIRKYKLDPRRFRPNQKTTKS